MEEYQVRQMISVINKKYGYDFSKYHQNYIKQELEKLRKSKNYQNID